MNTSVDKNTAWNGLQEASAWRKFEKYLNTLTHALIGISSFCILQFCVKGVFGKGWDALSWHVFLTSFSYQFLMSEAILALYAPNSWSFLHSYRVRKNIHWMLMTLAVLFIFSGIIQFSYQKSMPDRHFYSSHSITGILF